MINALKESAFHILKNHRYSGQAKNQNSFFSILLLPYLCTWQQ